MSRLAGLTSLYGNDPNLTPGGSVDEGALQAYDQSQQYKGAHSEPGDTSGQTWPAGYGVGYKGQGTYGINETGQITDFNDIPGYYVLTDLDAPIDRTPSSHAGLYPRPEALHITAQDGLQVVGEQAQLLHGVDEGGPVTFLGRAPGGHEENTHWSVDRYEAPNENALARESIGQLRGSDNGPRGMADVDQGYGELNSLPEFQAGHSIRYVQHDRLQFDTSLTGPDAEEGTWLGRWSTGTAASFNGPDSPYGARGDNKTGLMVAERRGYPTEFTQPVAPTVLPVAPGPQNDVWASSGVGGF